MRETPVIEPVAAGGDARKVSVAQVLVYELRVRDAMSQPPITAAPQDTLRSVQVLMKTHRISGVPITEHGAIVGVISIEDIINALDNGYINDPADRWMTRNPVTVRDHFSLMKTIAEFDQHRFGRFPVLDVQGKLVGVITHGDITACLMHHIEERAEGAIAHEAALIAQRKADEKAKRVVVHAEVKSGDFETAGRLSQRVRKVLRERGIDPDVRRRAAVVAYEAETNIIIHSIGGELTATIYPERVIIQAVDNGPGIENLDLAMKEGWSTAGPLARSLGFGAGMGLKNIKKCSDRFEISSTMGRPTRLTSEIRLVKAGLNPVTPTNENETKQNGEVTNIVADDSG